MNTNPKDLDEVVDLIISEIQAQADQEFVKKNGIPHHGAGTSIRNSLHLWWSEELRDRVLAKNPDGDYPREKPALVAWFNDRNIFHADDMSGTISAAMQAKLKGEDFDLDKHLQRYFKHWKKYGFKDGICLPEYKIGPDPDVITLDDEDDD